ncbi:hypothetical protein C8A01DRAFT_32317 [Parachaetomium inaequale]|uniref:Uncharacterized protein n=1 Tax=Parachaetomium inaequale TaxID=2588326 RepID=A0AAN6PMP6_9PEZI|nr:hypothetical protein C8A01DRAFT_32317 [Parachaetomium inaequale]
MPPKKAAGRGRGGRRGGAAESSRLRVRGRGPSPGRSVGAPSVYESSPELVAQPAPQPDPQPDPAPAAAALPPRAQPDPPIIRSGDASGAASGAANSTRRQQRGARATRAWDFTDVPLNLDQRGRNGRVAGRTLISWGRPRMAEKLLLHMQYEMVQAGLEIPFDRIAHRLRPGASGDERSVATSCRDPETDDLRSTRPVRYNEPFEDRLVGFPDAINLHANRRRQEHDGEGSEDGAEHEEALAVDQEARERAGNSIDRSRSRREGTPDAAELDLEAESRPHAQKRQRASRNAPRHASPEGQWDNLDNPENDNRQSGLFIDNESTYSAQANFRPTAKNTRVQRPILPARNQYFRQTEDREYYRANRQTCQTPAYHEYSSLLIYGTRIMNTTVKRLAAHRVILLRGSPTRRSLSIRPDKVTQWLLTEVVVGNFRKLNTTTKMWMLMHRVATRCMPNSAPGVTDGRNRTRMRLAVPRLGSLREM